MLNIKMKRFENFLKKFRKRLQKGFTAISICDIIIIV